MGAVVAAAVVAAVAAVAAIAPPPLNLIRETPEIERVVGQMRQRLQQIEVKTNAGISKVKENGEDQGRIRTQTTTTLQ